ncbi:MAG: hypothetical protein WC967_01960 [Balneolaceae bacterium]
MRVTSMRTFHFIYLISILFLFSQCTLDPINGSGNNTITEEDLEAATLILGDAISSNSGGVFLSVQDAIAIVSGQGVYPKVAPQNNSKSKFNYIGNHRTRYVPETGTHIVTFDRWGRGEMEHERDSLNYIYRDLKGNFVEYPMEQRDMIESVSYSGFKWGTIQEGEYIVDAAGNYNFITSKYSQYERNSNFFFTTTPNASNTVPFEGNHTGSGYIEYPKTDIENLNRYYELTMNFLNIELQVKEDDQEGRTAKSYAEVAPRNRLLLDFIGGLSWEMKTWSNPEKMDAPVIVSGTMSFNGNYEALVRFDSSNETMVIDLTPAQEVNEDIKLVDMPSTERKER